MSLLHIQHENPPHTSPDSHFDSNKRQDILPSEFALAMHIQFSLIISFLVINSRDMGSTSTNHGDGHIGINSVKN
jgi:hypothetical protein